MHDVRRASRPSSGHHPRTARGYGRAMSTSRRRWSAPTGGWAILGIVLASVGLMVVVTPLRALQSPEGVPFAVVAATLVLVGAWFVAYAVLSRPRTGSAAPLDPAATRMPDDPAIYDPADYERKPGFLVGVDGKSDVPVIAAVAGGSGLVAVFCFGLLGADRWIAYGGALLVAVVVWQVYAVVVDKGTAAVRTPE